MFGAAQKGHTETVELLHRLGADINFGMRVMRAGSAVRSFCTSAVIVAQDGRTVLMVASHGGHTPVVELLHRLGADVSAVTKVPQRPSFAVLVARLSVPA